MQKRATSRTVEFLFASREKSGVPRFENPPNLPVRNQHLQSLINNGMFNIWSAWTQLAPRITTLPPGLPPGRVIDGPRGEAIAAGAGGASSLRSKITDAVNTNVPHTLGWLNRGVRLCGIRSSRRTWCDAPVGSHDQPRSISTGSITIVRWDRIRRRRDRSSHHATSMAFRRRFPHWSGITVRTPTRTN